MKTATEQNRAYKGVLTGLKTRLHRNRLGELLVLNGSLSTHDLRHALAASKSTGKPLGRILAEEFRISYTTIRKTLLEQFMLRVTMGIMTIFLSFAGMGGGIKQARADGIRDVPARIAFQQAAAFSSIGQYPRIFGSSEKQSTSLSAFTKWGSMFDKFDAALNTADGQKTMETFKTRIESLRGQPMNEMLVGVNDIVNRIPYIADQQIYGRTDYWATPVEFIKRGGDCEDFAITKYVALRALGVPEERLRILILQDLQKNIPHAILIAYTDNGAVLLDNQIKSVTSVDRVSHYKPIFSINRQGWWLHTKPSNNVTVVASSSR